MKCPHCKGKKQSYVHVNYGYDDRIAGCRGEWKWVTCSRCAGSGEVPDEQATWMEAGEKLRLAHRAAGLNLEEEAKLRGLQPVDLSRMERGELKPYTLSEGGVS